ncbi:YdbL family protein [Limibacillus halophilus]
MNRSTSRFSPARRVFIGLALAGLLSTAFALPAFADQLDDLRKSGAVGERYDGLLVARDGSAGNFVKEVNAKRSSIYQQKATQQGVSVEAVGKVYAVEIFKKAPAGTYFQQENGSWVQK